MEEAVVSVLWSLLVGVALVDDLLVLGLGVGLGVQLFRLLVC